MKLDALKQGLLFGADRMLGDFLRSEDLCFTIQKEIAPRIQLADFEDMYSEGGRPPVSPKVMVLILILQYLERLSDRAAAHNLRYRLDWKIALGLEMDFKGIHPTTLVYFRDRLLANGKAGYAFDRVIEHLVAVGLVKKSAKQRIDSTHIIGNVRELSRLELLHETLRLFSLDVIISRLTLGSGLLDTLKYYSEDISIRGISDQQKAKYVREAGLTMRAFIDWVTRLPEGTKLKTTASFKTLTQVYTQNFQDDGTDPEGPKLIKIATGKDHICSPHEVDARYANKGGSGWLGYKAQVAETIPNTKGDVSFLTFIDVQEATEHDSSATAAYVAYQGEKQTMPSEVYADTHYNSSANIEALALDNIHLKGPVTPTPVKEALKKNQGFELDIAQRKIICPDGQETSRFTEWKDGRASGTFLKETCQTCRSSDACQPEKRGKRIIIRPESDLLKQRRVLMETEAFKRDMHKRNGIEGTLSGLVRGNGMRRSRFRGKAKAQLHIKLSGAAANISRLHRKRRLDAPVADKRVA